jgi:hypothetical protein
MQLPMPTTTVGVSPANCDTATTVVVNNPIDAVNDPSVTGSNNTVVTALNALTNDTLQPSSNYHQYQCNAINDRTIEH